MTRSQSQRSSPDAFASLTALTLLPRDDRGWMDDALCAQVDVGDVFYVDKGESTAPAKWICRRCDVQQECLDYALTLGERFGVWGGQSERERRKLETAGRTSPSQRESSTRDRRSALSSSRDQAPPTSEHPGEEALEAG